MTVMPHPNFPSGMEKGLFAIGQPIQTLCKDYGWTPIEHEDQLGPVLSVFLELESKATVHFSWRPGRPDLGTAVTTDDDEPALQVSLEVVRELSVKVDDISWVSPSVLENVRKY